MCVNYNILKKYLLLLPLLLVIPEACAQVSIQNDQKYIGDDAALHIVGEIYNGFTAPLNQIEVKVALNKGIMCHFVLLLNYKKPKQPSHIQKIPAIGCLI